MLTPSQQKVKQELDELKAIGSYNHGSDMNFPRTELPASKNRVYFSIGLVLFLVVISIAALYFSTPSQTKISSYLTKEQQYNRKSLKLFNDFAEKTSGDLESDVLKQASLVKKADDLSAPSGFEKHKLDFIDVMQHRLDILTYLSENKQADTLLLKKLLIELDVKQELAQDSLLKAFDREEIQYEEHVDGAFRYWIGKKSFRYE
ncbi:hypothetical protein [Neobacillus kokaensis]|uniref:Uncharacterized protein n=1 Tax=Neobacillus kokaensis TaxID=2759023 RepID=A0ABQ3N024_9BACI|nr:hypothetical protein [Neobacillus kokaensis]GHH97429.1 hypothetical protein AM1BK_09720 [Neobacillus kokaensis]